MFFNNLEDVTNEMLIVITKVLVFKNEKQKEIKYKYSALKISVNLIIESKTCSIYPARVIVKIENI